MNGNQDPPILQGQPALPPDPVEDISADEPATMAEYEAEPDNFFNPEASGGSYPNITSEPSTHTILTHEPGPIAWTAPSTLLEPKRKSWYGALLLGSVLIAIVVYLISKAIFSSIVIVFAALGFGAFSAKRPQDLSYTIDATGITIGQKNFEYDQFRSFCIVDESRHTSIALMPLKRFAPVIAVMYGSELEEQIVAALANHLPIEEYKKDNLDRITSRINL